MKNRASYNFSTLRNEKIRPAYETALFIALTNLVKMCHISGHFSSGDLGLGWVLLLNFMCNRKLHGLIERQSNHHQKYGKTNQIRRKDIQPYHHHFNL